MPRKDTLAMKKIVSDAVVGETKRCIAILNRTLKGSIMTITITPNIVEGELNQAIKEMVEGCPYLDFYPELRNKIRK